MRVWSQMARTGPHVRGTSLIASAVSWPSDGRPKVNPDASSVIDRICACIVIDVGMGGAESAWMTSRSAVVALAGNSSDSGVGRPETGWIYAPFVPS